METLREPEDADTSIFVSLAPEQRKRVASLVEPIFQENMAMWASGYAASAEATPVTQTPSFQALLNLAAALIFATSSLAGLGQPKGSTNRPENVLHALNLLMDRMVEVVQSRVTEQSIQTAIATADKQLMAPAEPGHDQVVDTEATLTMTTEMQDKDVVNPELAVAKRDWHVVEVEGEVEGVYNTHDAQAAGAVGEGPYAINDIRSSLAAARDRTNAARRQSGWDWWGEN